MNLNDLNDLWLPIVAALSVAGAFFFGNSSKDVSQTTSENDIQKPNILYSKDANGLTGVARYLKNQEISISTDQEVVLETQEIVPLVSKVEKYLQLRDQFPVSGVTKYLRRQAIVEKQTKQSIAQVKLTGVANYLKNQKPVPVMSGVAKYLKKQESLPQPSKVAKYMTKQALVAKQDSQARAASQIKLTGVDKYLKYQENLPQPSKVAKYMAKQAAAEKQAKLSVVQIKETGVTKYLKHQETLPQSSRVAKYVARQAIAARQKPIVIQTGVEKYVRDRT